MLAVGSLRFNMLRFNVLRGWSARTISCGNRQAIFRMLSLSAMRASMHALHDWADNLQTSLVSACGMHMSMLSWHIATRAYSHAGV